MPSEHRIQTTFNPVSIFSSHQFGQPKIHVNSIRHMEIKMSLTKTTLLAAAAIVAIAGIGSTSNSARAGFGNNERLNTCSWYKARAMSNGRQGYFEESEQYWFLYRQCMKNRID
jgi:hypothetical protein